MQFDGSGKIIGSGGGSGGGDSSTTDQMAEGALGLAEKILQFILPVSIKSFGKTSPLPDLNAGIAINKNIMPSGSFSGATNGFLPQLFEKLKSNGMQIKSLVEGLEGLPIKDMPIEALANLSPMDTGGGMIKGGGMELA